MQSVGTDHHDSGQNGMRIRARDTGHAVPEGRHPARSLTRKKRTKNVQERVVTEAKLEYPDQGDRKDQGHVAAPNRNMEVLRWDNDPRNEIGKDDRGQHGEHQILSIGVAPRRIV